MVSKSFVQSFSYQVGDAETVEAAARLAKTDNVSFSQLILRLLKEEVQKNQVGEYTPISIIYGTNPNKSCQTDLMEWFSHVDQITEQNELNKIKGQALEIVRRSDKRSMELRMNELRRL